MPPADRTITEQAQETFRTSFPACREALARARRSFADWLRRRTDGDVVAEMEIVFSELAANAVDASPAPTDEVTGEAWYEGPDLVLDLTNRADPSKDAGPGWDLDDPLRTGGRGLVITEAFVDSMEVSLAPGQRLLVRCRRRVD